MNKEKSSSLLYLSWLIAILLIPVLITQFFLVSQLESLKKDVDVLNGELELLKNNRRLKRGVASTVIDCSQCPGYPKRRRKGYIDVQVEPPNGRPTLASRRATIATATTAEGPVGPPGDVGASGLSGAAVGSLADITSQLPGYSDNSYPISYSSWYSYGPSYGYSSYGYPGYTSWSQSYGDSSDYTIPYSGSKSWTGLAGYAGEPGEPGEPGLPGLPGAPGMPGDPGYPGAPGMAGDPGYPGAHGMAGEPGYPGSPGMPGDPGYPGLAGMPGEPGYPGGQGMPGGRGQSGLPGSRGAPVGRGLHGEAGGRGALAQPGSKGPTRISGSPALTGSVAWRGLPMGRTTAAPQVPIGCIHTTCTSLQNDATARPTVSGQLSYRSLDRESAYSGTRRRTGNPTVPSKMRGDLGDHDWTTGTTTGKEEQRRYHPRLATTAATTTSTTTTSEAPKTTSGPEVKKALILYKLEIRNYNVSDDTTVAPTIITTTTPKPPDKPSGFDFMTSSKARDYILAYRDHQLKK